jgi:rod shape determining protein RodA
MAVIHIQGDDGTVLIFALVFIVMCLWAGIKLRYFAVFGAITAALVPLIWGFVMNDEHRNRLLALFFPDESTVTGYGWQQYQGKLSIAGGGLFGSGIFNGNRVQRGIVPEQENDFILTVAGEELGFIGCIIVLVLLLFIMLRILKTAKNSADYRGKLICGGVFALIASQVIINLGMVLGFFPVIGVTLPLFSSGGSSVISVLICIGLVQSVYSAENNSAHG